MVKRSFRASSGEIAKSLGYNPKMVDRLKNEIEKEILEKVKRYTAETEFSDINKINKKLVKKLNKIIANPKTSNTVRQNAINTLKKIYFLIPNLKKKIEKETPKIDKVPKIDRIPKIDK